MSLKRKLRTAARVASRNVRLAFGKLVHGGRLKYSPLTCLVLSDAVEISPSGSLDLSRRLRTRGHCSFNVQESGSLSFGEGVFLNSDCQFNCHSRIAVGAGCEFGSNVLAYDHDHAYRGVLKDGGSCTVTCPSGSDAGSGRGPSSFEEPVSATAASWERGASSRGSTLPDRWYSRGARRRFEMPASVPPGPNGRSVLYVGGFTLPDGNAAAHRVVANARILRRLGYGVVFLNYSKATDEPRLTEYFGFACFECPKREWDGAGRMDVDRVEEAMGHLQGLSCVIAYNYPAPALSKLLELCRRRGVACVGDVTEWYRARDVSPLKVLPKFADTFWRMRVLNRRMDGLIVISRYLERFYGESVPVVALPPLVDAGDPKWGGSGARGGRGGTRLVYAGRPSRTKERLDLVVSAVLAQDPADMVSLEVVGVTAPEYRSIYGSAPDDPRIAFRGKLPHAEALQAVKGADYAVVIRDDNRVTRAGFPTKFAESVTCGTPVICNDNSDLAEWVGRFGCGVLVDEGNLAEGVRRAARNRVRVKDRELFDYRRFEEPMGRFMEEVEARKGGRKV